MTRAMYHVLDPQINKSDYSWYQRMMNPVNIYTFQASQLSFRDPILPSPNVSSVEALIYRLQQAPIGLQAEEISCKH